jgi:hypothetical protein
MLNKTVAKEAATEAFIASVLEDDFGEFSVEDEFVELSDDPLEDESFESSDVTRYARIIPMLQLLESRASAGNV